MKTLIHSFVRDRLFLARSAAVIVGLSFVVPAPALAFDANAASARLTELGIKVSNQAVSPENLDKISYFSAGNQAKNLTDADLAMLASLPGLRVVDLSNTGNVTPEGIKALAASQSIKTLRLTTINVGDIGAAAIGNMAQLESLLLDSVKGITAASAPAIAGLKQLRELQLSDVPFDDSALSRFAQHPKLAVVGLTRMKTISDTGLAHLGTAPNIRALDVSFTSMTGKFVDAFANSKNLTDITVSNANLNDADLRGLSKLKNFQRLDFRNNAGVGDATLAEMAKMPTIRVAFLEKTGITDKGLSAIGKLPNLAELVISETAATDAGIASLQLPKLKLIAIQGTKITDATVEKLASHPTLTRLVIHKTVVTKDGIAKALAGRAANLPRLSIEN